MARPVSKVSKVRVTGPLAPFAEGFRLRLRDLGYTPLSAVNQLRLVAQLSRWLEARRLGTADLTDERVEKFLAARRASGYTGSISRRALTPLLEFLAAEGELPPVAPAAPASRSEEVLAAFHRYLLSERGLAASTAGAYVLRARRFIAGCAPGGRLGEVTAADVTRAVLDVSAALSVGSAQMFVAALRSFLRFCHIEELTGADLSAAALSVTGRRSSSLPRGISPSEANALLASCDRRRAIGRRDYAVIVMLLRLGLRAGEMAALRLDDIDWRGGEIVVHGKGGREDRLPLPVDVGQAIAGYLRHGRPTTTRREVFMSAIAPIDALGRGAVSLIVRRACLRAGVPPVGAHRLRHTLACQMVRAGVPLPEIGQVLPSFGGLHGRLCPGRCRRVAHARAALAGRVALMNELSCHVEDYLSLRRALGFKLEREGQVLPQLVAYLDAAGASTLTAELAIAWAKLPVGVHPVTWTHRLGAARGFATYLKTIDPATEIPARDVFAGQGKRPVPYLWSHDDIDRLLEAAGQLQPPLKAATSQTLFGLLAVSGMRISEALGLDRSDVDLGGGVITVREGKFRRERLIPLHASAAGALRSYAAYRDRVKPQPASTAFFISWRGGAALGYSGVRDTFNLLATEIGLRTATVNARIHDYAEDRVMPTRPEMRLLSGGERADAVGIITGTRGRP